MARLRDRRWHAQYSSSDGDLVEIFWVPALACAQRYDRTTGYFTATALTLAARGLEELVRGDGRMRLIVGCTLDDAEVEAILRGRAIAEGVAAALLRNPLAAERPEEIDALELLAWMVARGHLEVKVAVPCDQNRRPLAGTEIFHAKFGIFEDRVGDRIAFTGSINETPQGWQGNFEQFHVFTSWGPDAAHVRANEEDFEELWTNRSPRAIVLDVPEAVVRALLRFRPKDGALPRRLREKELAEEPAVFQHHDELRRQVWSYIAAAPDMPGGEWLAEATCPVELWPHQRRTYEVLWKRFPPRYLIADEVGLGKTIQIGILLRQAVISGRAKRVLIVAPASLLRQWQTELRDKFALNWPIYDGRRLVWHPSPALAEIEREVGPDRWHEEPFVLVSCQLVRRRERARELVERARPWDLIVLDEAHHARRRGARPDVDEPNLLLSLMRRLARRTRGLLLATATPMQLHPIEIWDLLALLGLPEAWSAERFLRFFEIAGKSHVDHPELDFLAEMFRAVETWDGPVRETEAETFFRRRGFSFGKVKIRRILAALRNDATIPRRQLQGELREAAVALTAAHTPIVRKVRRNTRDLLRSYRRSGMLEQNIAERRVVDDWIPMTSEERELYEAVETYIRDTLRRTEKRRRAAVGFMLTIYRRRLASSVHALRCTLERGIDEEALREEEELAEELDLELDEAVAPSLEAPSRKRLLELCSRLDVESKAVRLLEHIERLRTAGFERVVVFTQYTDTMDFLVRSLASETGVRIGTYSGRGGEIVVGGRGVSIKREDLKRHFAAGKLDLLVCTDAAAEGLNLHCAGALVNYDMPWNPMRVEQRIGRIDRLGQRHDEVHVLNLHYEGTVEADVYFALRHRVGLFEKVVGPLQPILARLPRWIEEGLTGERPLDAEGFDREVDRLARTVPALDLDELVEGGVSAERPRPPYDLSHLARLLGRPELLPDRVEVERLGPRDWAWRDAHRTGAIRVTADADFYDDYPESTELFTPGSPIFPCCTINVDPPSFEEFERALGVR